MSNITPPAPPVRTVNCPACKGESLYASSNPYRPFCSARCKGVDFNLWASESYRVPAKPSPEDGLELPPELPIHRSTLN